MPLRRHHVLLTAWTVLWFFLVEPSGGFSWHYLRQGEQLLFSHQSDGGLSLYAHHPELQIGPVSLAAARLTAPFPPHIGQLIAEAVSAGLGLVMLVLVGRTAALYYLGTGTNHRRLQQRLLIAGLAFIPMWVEVSVRFAHLDDVLALFFTTLAAHALARGKPVQVAIFLALAVDSKPWALAFAPLILALPRPAWLRTVLWFCFLVAIAWLPFYLGNLDTMAAAKFTIPNQPASALRWFGVTDPSTPWWDRPTQFALGIGLGCIAVWRGRWPAVVLLGADARILLDPSVYTYYTASILLGTLLWDAVGQKRLVPWWSWIALVALYGGTLLLPSDAARGFVRLAFVVVSAAYVLLWPTQQTRRPRPPAQRGGDGRRRSARRRERELVGA
ncbi:hypothetical protein ABTZ03_22190 [Kitasatospora sp. NPDC096077]|uniref:hypothetical protein n=1 Tax=Kitasatospora sp. NPDC096077 TaxID=3155544 RepID=UPI00332CB137